MENKKILFLNFDKNDSVQSSWLNSFLSEEENKHCIFKSLTYQDFQNPEKVRTLVIYLEHDETVSITFVKQLFSNKFFTHIFFVCSDKSLNSQLLFEYWTNGINALLHIKDFTYNYDYLIFSSIKGAKVISPTLTYFLVPNSSTRSMSIPDLSDKELFVLQKLSEGLRYDTIANELNLTIDGVRYHIRNLYTALGVNNKAEAIMKGIKLKIVKVEK